MGREKIYRTVSVILAASFAVVGFVFFFIPERVILFFNAVSPLAGFRESPVHGASLFVVLAAAYMYLVTLLAAMMAKHPGNKIYPVLLIHGKTASAALSIALFLFRAPYLILLTNAVVDGSIAAGVLILMKKTTGAKK